jgi:hypothetical protein
MGLFSSSKKPQTKAEVLSVQPTRTIFLKQHIGLAKTITAYDITSVVKSEFASDEFKKEARELANSGSVPPCLKMYLSNIFTKKYSIKMPLELISQPVPAEPQADADVAPVQPAPFSTSKADLVEVSELTLALFANGAKKLTFDPEHTNKTPNLKLKPCGESSEEEAFTLNGITYKWQLETKALTVTKFNLVKQLPDRSLVIGRLWAPAKWMRSSAITFDEGELDWIVVMSTCCALIAKLVQKVGKDTESDWVEDLTTILS